MGLSFLTHPEVIILAKFVVAMLLGAVIGLEREAADEPAGLRTHMLVVGSSCLLVSLNESLITPLSGDPMRVVHGIITGIAFLGAGTIIRSASGERVEGLTTAASIFLSSVVGIYVGLSKFLAAAGITLLTVLVLHYLGRLSHRISDHRPKNSKA